MAVLAGGRVQHSNGFLDGGSISRLGRNGQSQTKS